MEDESCRILTISSSGSAALAFIESLKALAAPHPTSSDPPLSSGPPFDSSSIPFTVPWTITNRYYTADVHFSAWTVDKLFAELFERQPPTVVFVWFDGEPYANHIAEVARLMKLKDYEPEVALAVRIPAPVASSSSSQEHDRTGKDTMDADGPVDKDDNGDIDITLMSFGFEYVDGTRRFMRVSGSSNENIEDDIPALPRVLDALGTIMWPSMRSIKEESGDGGHGRLSAGRGLLDLNRSFDDVDSEDDREDLMQELLLESATGSLSLFERGKKLGREGQTQEQLGEVDEEDKELMEQMKAFVMDAERTSQRKRERPHWISTSSPTTTCGSEVTMSPTEMYAEKDMMSPFGTQQATFNGNLDGEEGRVLTEELTLGFEDDFTVFVSAPPQSQGMEQSKPAVSLTSFDSMGSLAPDVGFRYRSLGSVSDFGDDFHDGEGEHVYDPLDGVHSDSDGEDSVMPSKSEIKDTARRIFGERHSIVPDEDDRHGFDVEQVFGVLQGYKHEIAGMTDEEEKRKAAAKVALGLVYGLEGTK